MYWPLRREPELKDIPYGSFAHKLNGVWAIVGRFNDINFKIYSNQRFGKLMKITLDPLQKE